MFEYQVKHWLLAAASAATLVVSVGANAADKKEEPSIPVCDKRFGTLSVVEPEDSPNRYWYREAQLESPVALIKVFVSQSKCFTLVDRGKGLEAAQAERALAGGGELRGGSNVGKGQMKAADYVLVPDLVTQNANAGGNKIGGLLGGFVPGVAGVLLGGINLKKKEADVVLTLTDVRSTEQISLQQGHAKKTDLGWSAGGAFFAGGGFAAGGASGYANTEIGKIVTKAYLDAYIKMVDDVRAIAPDAKANNVQQSVTMAKAGVLYVEANNKSEKVRDLDPGLTLYPTGEKNGIWWKVQDELGNEGWVTSPLFGLAK
jgi:curli biogenesis system outer membrane secretion channel CsgG